MRSLVQRLFGIAKTRAFDAAGGGRRWEGAKGIEARNASILAGATMAARRAGRSRPQQSVGRLRLQGLVANAIGSGVKPRAMHPGAANAIGSGVKPRAMHPDAAVRDRLHALWNHWTDRADATGLTDFYGLQALALRAMVESGESFTRLRFAEADDGSPQPIMRGPPRREAVLPRPRFFRASLSACIARRLHRCDMRRCFPPLFDMVCQRRRRGV